MDMQPDNALFMREAASLVRLGDDTLYSMLLPINESTAAYSPEGRVLQGRRLFDSMLEKVKSVICSAYSNIRDDVPQLVQLASILAASLRASGQIADAAIVPFCILVIRHGLDSICLRFPDV
jgi:hypothetical protein